MILAFLLGGASLAYAQEAIKVGIVMGLTGPWASIDTPALNGIKLATEEINQAGGFWEDQLNLKQ